LCDQEDNLLRSRLNTTRSLSVRVN